MWFRAVFDVVFPGKLKKELTALRSFLLPTSLLAVMLLLAGVLGLLGCDQKPKPVLKLFLDQWESMVFNNALAEFIIEKGYGYPVETVEMTSHMSQKAIEEGQIDLNMEAWQQNRLDWYNEQIRKGSIVNLGMTYEGGPQFFMIPRWVAEQHNIKTTFDSVVGDPCGNNYARN
jgi:glycine betaine/proline transport system substrate-binding protein